MLYSGVFSKVNSNKNASFLLKSIVIEKVREWTTNIRIHGKIEIVGRWIEYNFRATIVNVWKTLMSELRITIDHIRVHLCL